MNESEGSQFYHGAIKWNADRIRHDTLCWHMVNCECKQNTRCPTKILYATTILALPNDWASVDFLLIYAKERSVVSFQVCIILLLIIVWREIGNYFGLSYLMEESVWCVIVRPYGNLTCTSVYFKIALILKKRIWDTT